MARRVYVYLGSKNDAMVEFFPFCIFEEKLCWRILVWFWLTYGAPLPGLKLTEVVFYAGVALTRVDALEDAVLLKSWVKSLTCFWPSRPDACFNELSPTGFGYAWLIDAPMFWNEKPLTETAAFVFEWWEARERRPMPTSTTLAKRLLPSCPIPPSPSSCAAWLPCLL